MKRQAFTMWVMAVAAGVAGVSMERHGWPFWWLAANFALLGGSYYRNVPGIYGKRPNGTLPVWSWMVFLPQLLLTHLLWYISIYVVRDGGWQKVSDDLIIGRRLLNHEMPEGVANYVDLTAEFSEPARARALPAYNNFRILDAGIPEVSALRQSIASLKPGPTFVHCAQGRSRTALFAVALLLINRKVATVDEGMALIRAARPGMHMNPEQRRCAEAIEAAVRQEGGAA